MATPPPSRTMGPTGGGGRSSHSEGGSGFLAHGPPPPIGGLCKKNPWGAAGNPSHEHSASGGILGQTQPSQRSQHLKGDLASLRKPLGSLTGRLEGTGRGQGWGGHENSRSGVEELGPGGRDFLQVRLLGSGSWEAGLVLPWPTLPELLLGAGAGLTPYNPARQGLSRSHSIQSEAQRGYGVCPKPHGDPFLTLRPHSPG